MGLLYGALFYNLTSIKLKKFNIRQLILSMGITNPGTVAATLEYSTWTTSSLREEKATEARDYVQGGWGVDTSYMSMWSTKKVAASKYFEPVQNKRKIRATLQLMPLELASRATKYMRSPLLILCQNLVTVQRTWNRYTHTVLLLVLLVYRYNTSYRTALNRYF